MTLVAMICDVPHIQPYLPQVLICNERTIPTKKMAAIRARLPKNVHLLRQRSAWNNIDLMIWIIRLLGVALSPFMADYAPWLLLDAAKIHIHERVLHACRRAGLLPGLVPAVMTFLLQPLDIRGFLPLKVQVQKEYQACRIRAAGGVVPVEDWLMCVCSAIQYVLQTRC